MTFDGYQSQTHRTNLYPKEHMLFCLLLGLNSEVGELSGIFKKTYRGDEHYTKGNRLLLKAEIGDILWYLSELCIEQGLNLSECAEYNLIKLQKRAENGTIKGSGDER